MKKYFYILFFLFSFSFSDLINPENASTLNYIHVLFEWEQESYASTYNFQLDTSLNFNNPIVDINNESLIYIDTENINWETTYYWRVRPVDINGASGEWIDTLSFTTGSTRSNAYSINYNDNQYSNGVTIFSSFFNYYSAMIDQNGDEIWNTGSSELVYYNTDFNGQLFGCQLDNSLEHNIPGVEFDIDSNILWQEPNEDFFHHELIKLKNGNYLGLVEELQPGPVAPGPWSAQFQAIGYLADGVTPELFWVGDRIVEWDKDTNEEVWSWSVFDYYSMQDYDIEGETWYQAFYDGRYDWTHVNALYPVYDENDNIESIYLSCRHLSRISKVNYESKEIDFNLGREMASGDVNCGEDIGFSFPHSVTVLDNGNIVTLDNGNLSTLWLDTEYSTSRALELSVTETENSCEASIEWEYSLPEELFGFASGNVQKLDNGNYLIVTVGDGGTALEVNTQKEHVWEGKLNLQLPNGAVYRASRLSGLYPISYSVILNDAIIENNNNYLEVLNNDSVANFSITIYNEGSSAEQFHWEIGQESGDTEYLNPGENFIINNNQNLFTNQELLSLGQITISLTPKHRYDLKKDININFIEVQCDGDFDCSGVCNGDVFLDECGVCDGPGAIYECGCDDGQLHCRDLDGDGWGTSQFTYTTCDIEGDIWVTNCEDLDDSIYCESNENDCAGILCGDTIVDECGVCGGDNSLCLDCAGEPSGDALEDNCGQCDNDSSNDCTQDCNGVWGGDAIVDECGICNGNGIQDYYADWDGDGYGDCDSVYPFCPNDIASWVSDVCGDCNNGDANAIFNDCAGVCGGSAELDECGTCDNDSSNDCTQDCNGVWGGDALTDNCGVCGGDNSTCLDCNGVANGDSEEDQCGICDNDSSNDCTQDCNGEWGGAAVYDCAGICGGDSVIDECGFCDGSGADDGYTYFEEIPSSTILLDGSQCFSDTDLNSLSEIININNLDIESPIHLGTQNWSGGRITRLEVGNYFQGGSVTLHTIPESIGDMTNLGVLYFNYNELTQLPNSITELSNLIYLVLSFNQLTSFPENLGNLSQLIWLDAGYNELESIPESIGELNNLSYLWIFNNNLTYIPESICNLNINWNGDDFQFLPYFGAGANSLCDEVPVCIENSSNLNSSIDPLYYSFEITLEQECSDQCLIMDVNNDGLINVIDIVNTVNIILGISSNPSEIELCAADANSDDVINVIDVVTIVNFIFSF